MKCRTCQAETFSRSGYCSRKPDCRAMRAHWRYWNVPGESDRQAARERARYQAMTPEQRAAYLLKKRAYDQRRRDALKRAGLPTKVRTRKDQAVAPASRAEDDGRRNQSGRSAVGKR